MRVLKLHDCEHIPRALGWAQAFTLASATTKSEFLAAMAPVWSGVRDVTWKCGEVVVAEVDVVEMRKAQR